MDAKLNGRLNQFKCDMDRDGIPDICDDDIDGDSVPNGIDGCPYTPDPNNICSFPDADHDGVSDGIDLCNSYADPLNACDSDGDNVRDRGNGGPVPDNCPNVSNPLIFLYP